MLIASESLHQLNQVKDFVRTIIRLQPFEIRKTVCGSPVWDQRLIASSVNGSACCEFIISFQLPHAQAECSSQLQHGLQCRGHIQHQFKLEKKRKRIRNLKPAYWIPQYCPMCFVLVLLKSIFWLLARLLKAQRMLFKLQEVANLTYLRGLLSQSRISNSKGTSQSVRHTHPRR